MSAGEMVFPSVEARFLVRRRQADRALDWIAYALSLAGTEPFATWTLHHGWFMLNDARAEMETLRV